MQRARRAAAFAMVAVPMILAMRWLQIADIFPHRGAAWWTLEVGRNALIIGTVVLATRLLWDLTSRLEQIMRAVYDDSR